MPASLVLTEPVPPEEMTPLVELGLRADNSAVVMGGPIAPSQWASDDVLRGLEVPGPDWFAADDLDRYQRCFTRIGLGPASPVRHWAATRSDAVVGFASSFRFGATVEMLHCGVERSHRRFGFALESLPPNRWFHVPMSRS